MQQMSGMMQIAPLFWLVGLFGIFVRGVLIAAVLRAVLEPENKGFFYLRLGAQELWQTLLAFAMSFVLAAFLFFGVAILVCAILAVNPGVRSWARPRDRRRAFVIGLALHRLHLHCAPLLAGVGDDLRRQDLPTL